MKNKKYISLGMIVVLSISLFLSGCSKENPSEKDTPSSSNLQETQQSDSEKETETDSEKPEKDEEEKEVPRPKTTGQNDENKEQEIDPEVMDQIKYNLYVELNNDMVELADNIYYYYTVVKEQEEFSLIPDTGHTYGYQITGFNSDMIEEVLTASEMEPSYGKLDELVQKLADPTKKLMDAFSEIGRSSNYADNQYQKPKELHAIIYQVVPEFEAVAYDFFDEITKLGDERSEKDREKMKEEGLLIIYNASEAINIGRLVLRECEKQEVNDSNITDLDLKNIKSYYDDLVTTVAAFNKATSDNDQLVKESLSNSQPFGQLFESLIQAIEWLINQVESGKPLEYASLEPLGSIAHVSNTLSKCIDRYNSVFVD